MPLSPQLLLETECSPDQIPDTGFLEPDKLIIIYMEEPRINDNNFGKVKVEQGLPW
jgi:hypothetical protein